MRRLVLWGCLPAAALVCAGWLTGCVINITSSLPLGVYRVDPSTVPGRGDLAVWCADRETQAEGIVRGYVTQARSRYCGESLPIIKRISAVAGDRITVTAQGVWVNNVRQRGSQPRATDATGRPLIAALGEHVLSEGQVWVQTSNPDSWDSRYFGPVAGHQLVGTATALVIVSG